MVTGYGVSGEVRSGPGVISAFSALVPALAVRVVSRGPAHIWIARVLAISTFLLPHPLARRPD